jgi:hypothetical protein
MGDELLPYFQRKLLKFKDPFEYKNQKFIQKLQQLKPIDLNIPPQETYHFKHSGHAGDIIYSLPSLKELSGGKATNFYLSLNRKVNYGKLKHPLGNIMLNEKTVEALHPLLQAQDYISNVLVHNGEAIHYDFDYIRDYPFMQNSGSIARWYFYFFAINADLGKAWINVEPDSSWKDYIIISRSFRYRQPLISYGFLKKYTKLLFVGLEDEYADMKKQLPSLEYVKVQNFLQLAQIIKGGKFFIGNQSFPFSLAEAMKVKRVLEVFVPCPNVIPEGANGYDFIYQPQFEKIVERLYNEV